MALQELSFASEDEYFRTSLILNMRELKLINNLLVNHIKNNPSDEDIQDYKWLQETTYNNFMNSEPVDQSLFEKQVVDNVQYLDAFMTSAIGYGLDARDIAFRSIGLLAEVAVQDDRNIYASVRLLEDVKIDIIKGAELPVDGVTYAQTPITVYGVLISGEPIKFETPVYNLPVFEKVNYPQRFELLKQYLNDNKLLTLEPIDNYYIYCIEVEDDNFEWYEETWYITTK